VAWSARIRRLLHVLVVALVVIWAFQAIQAIGGHQFLTISMSLRDGAGLTGLAALGVVVVGASLAWLFPVVWCAAAMMTPPSSIPAVQVITWLLQPAESTAATITAIVLGLGGTIAYALRGPA
jgi:hypothetical protein